MRPVVLSEYVLELDLPQTTERVFWLHFEHGVVNGDMCSALPLSVVAKRVRGSISTVTRAYQHLIKLGLLRRVDSGRNPENPFCRGVAVTELLVPETLFQLASKAKCRNTRDRSSEYSSNENTEVPETMHDITPRPYAGELQALKDRHGRKVSDHVHSRMSAAEKQRLFELQRNPSRLLSTDWAADSDTQLTVGEQGWVWDFLDGYRAQILKEREGAKPVQATSKVSTATTGAQRAFSSAQLNEIRLYIAKVVSADKLDGRMAEFIWDAQNGWLASKHQSVIHALRTFGKLCRAGTWSRPNRMPPNWRIHACNPSWWNNVLDGQC